MATNQPMRRFAADNPARFGNIPQAKGDVPRFADQRNDIVVHLDDGRPGMEANPRFDVDGVSHHQLPADRLEILDDAKAGCRGAPGRVLVGDRIAEARQQAVLVAFHDDAVQALHRSLAGLLERPEHAGLIFSVQLFQEQIGREQAAAAGEYRHLTPFGLALEPS